MVCVSTYVAKHGVSQINLYGVSPALMSVDLDVSSQPAAIPLLLHLRRDQNGRRWGVPCPQEERQT